ncbi:hypothetical protein PIB30_082551 [Stylosanthes scabra]|uniref:Uncharacterized protein n=1 Tax=Stylosanthes scabra TaxID=79078 RepID=A0ABU6WRP8_9FABA|nr:hypothetical protein [Stylosanthes scabra]
MAENDKKASLKAQAPRDPTRKQPITIEEDAFEDQARHPKKKKKVHLVNQKTVEAGKNFQIGNQRAAEAEKNQQDVEAHAIDQSDNSSEDEEEDARGLGTDKKGMSLDMYFKVHGINLDDEEDEEDVHDEAKVHTSNRFKAVGNASTFSCMEEIQGTSQASSFHQVQNKEADDTEPAMPLEIPEAVSEKNIENRSKQTCPHRMGSTGYGIVCKQLCNSKENNEEPLRAEIFRVTRNSKKGKEIDPKSQATIDELQHRIEVGKIMRMNLSKCGPTGSTSLLWSSGYKKLS